MRKCILQLLTLLLMQHLFGQNVGIGTPTPSPSALLDIAATDKGLLIPRVALVSVAQATPVVSPVPGLVVFNTSFNAGLSQGFYFWNGIKWLRLATNEEVWNTKGNEGLSGIPFIGTTDNTSLLFRIRNVNSGLIDSNINKTMFGFATARAGGGVHNSAFGYKALSLDASQTSSNTAIGSEAMELLRRGSLNAALGSFALRSLDSGFNNTAIGSSAMDALISGTANTAIGNSTLPNVPSGDSNTVVGFRASVVRNSQIVRSTAIGALATVGRSDALVLGSVEGENSATRGVFVGIGTINPQRKLHVVNGTSTGINSSINSTLVLDRANASNHLSILVSNNQEAALIFGKSGSLLQPFDGGIFYNTNGNGTMQFRNSGGLNRMIIHDNGNVSIGASTNTNRLLVAESGTLSGLSSFGNSTLALDGGNNAQYLSMLTAGSEQGILFGNSSTNRDGAIFYNNLDRAMSFRTANSNRMVLTNSGSLGIGTNSPQYRLHVVTADPQNFGYLQGIMVENTATGTDAQGNVNTGESAISFKNAGSAGTGARQWIVGLNQNRNLAFAYGNDFAGGNVTKMVLDSTGNLGIGTTSPTEKLQVVGNILASGTVTPSDVRYKKNFSSLNAVLPLLLAIQPMYYQYNPEAFPEMGFTDERKLGVLAQQLEKDFPELVVTNAKGYKAVDYSKLSVVLLKAVQEQQVLIAGQQAQLQGVMERIATLEAKLADR